MSRNALFIFVCKQKIFQRYECSYFNLTEILTFLNKFWCLSENWVFKLSQFFRNFQTLISNLIRNSSKSNRISTILQNQRKRSYPIVQLKCGLFAIIGLWKRSIRNGVDLFHEFHFETRNIVFELQVQGEEKT